MGVPSGRSVSIADIQLGKWQTIEILHRANGQGYITRIREDGVKDNVNFSLYPIQSNSPKLTLGGSWVAGDRYYLKGDISRFSISRPWEDTDAP